MLFRSDEIPGNAEEPNESLGNAEEPEESPGNAEAADKAGGAQKQDSGENGGAHEKA